MAKIARPEIEIEELTGEGSGILKKNALLYGKELGEHCRNVYRSCYARRQ